MVYGFRAKNHRVKLWSFRCQFIYMKYHWHLSFHEHSMYICSSVASREMHANLNECSLLYERAPLFLAKRAKVIKVTWTLFFAFYCNTSTITEHTKPNLFIQTIQFCSISLLYVCTLLCLSRTGAFLLLLSVSLVRDVYRCKRILSCVLKITDDNVISSVELCHWCSQHTRVVCFSFLLLDFKTLS